MPQHLQKVTPEYAKSHYGVTVVQGSPLAEGKEPGPSTKEELMALTHPEDHSIRDQFDVKVVVTKQDG
jgi:hypothetical protein